MLRTDGTDRLISEEDKARGDLIVANAVFMIPLPLWDDRD